MTDAPSRSRHLVDPTLLPLLDLFPTVPLDDAVLKEMRERGWPLPAAEPEIAAAVPRTRRTVPGSRGAPDVPVDVYLPNRSQGSTPAILHIHGGGYVAGSAAAMEPVLQTIAYRQGCAIVSVEYRLAPETRAPGAVEDCYAALSWIVAHAGELGIDALRIGVMGESAGGGLAAALALLARDRGEHRLAFQHLIYPMLDDRTAASDDPHPVTGEYIWTPHNNRFGWAALLGHAPGEVEVSPYASPARAASLAGLPPTFISTGALDLFLEEDLEYARRLIRDGVPCELHVYPGAFHAFDMAPVAAVAAAARRDSAEALARALARTAG